MKVSLEIYNNQREVPVCEVCNPFSADVNFDNELILMEYRNGSRVSLHINTHSTIPQRRMLICGTEGTIEGISFPFYFLLLPFLFLLLFSLSFPARSSPQKASSTPSLPPRPPSNFNNIQPIPFLSSFPLYPYLSLYPSPSLSIPSLSSSVLYMLI